ncbi:MAG: hypothetical protein ACPH9F_01700 [Candidatus Poseidoniaceae archaeon]
MGEGGQSVHLPFRAVKIIETPEVENVHAIAVGVDGELCRLDDQWAPIEQHARPFPMSIQQSIVVGDVLVATWIDRELLLARMGCMPLDQPFRDGVERGDLRIARELEHAILPEGALWAHVLDAEPLALSTMGDGFAFVLWNRGVYGFGVNGVERWRSPPPEWPELSHLPMSQETVALHETETTIEVWSRAGGCLRLSKSNGTKIGTGHFDIEGALTDVYGTNSQRLLLLNDGRCYQYKEGVKVADLATKGPIQNALYRGDGTWILSGWREEIALGKTGVRVLKQNEVVVQHLMKEDQLWLLTNDGILTHSLLTE